MGVLASLPASQGFQSGQVIDGNTLRDLALSSQYVLVGAYDEEARLVWTRSRSVRTELGSSRRELWGGLTKRN